MERRQWNRDGIKRLIAQHEPAVADNVARSYPGKPYGYGPLKRWEAERDAHVEKVVADRRIHLEATLPDCPAIHRIIRKWEHPVTTEKKFIVGYVDMLVHVQRSHFSIRNGE